LSIPGLPGIIYNFTDFYPISAKMVKIPPQVQNRTPFIDNRISFYSSIKYKQHKIYFFFESRKKLRPLLLPNKLETIFPGKKPYYLSLFPFLFFFSSFTLYFSPFMRYFLLFSELA
jgi:hypothetical protein